MLVNTKTTSHHALEPDLEPDMEPDDPEGLDASLRRGVEQALRGEVVDISQVKGLEWLFGSDHP